MEDKIVYKDRCYAIYSNESGIYECVDLECDRKFTLNVEQFKVFKQITEKNQIELKNDREEIISFYNDMITFEPFQYKPYLKLIDNNNKDRCLYIADEVGVGKTYETGIIISELLYSGRVDLNEGILIICPNMLCKKWQEVLDMFFGLSSKIIKSATLLSNISIMSFDSVSRCYEMDENVKIGLLIIDEAHNVSNARYEKIMKFRKNSNYTVLLSATPLSGQDKDLGKQIELLFNKANMAFSFEEESCYLNRTLKDEMRQGDIKWHIENIPIKNNILEGYISICKQLFSGRNTLRKFVGLNMVGSSPASAKVYMDYLLKLEFKEVKRLFIGSQLNKDEIEEYGFESLNELIEVLESEDDQENEMVDDDLIIDILENIKDLSSKNRDLKTDSKLEKLKIIIDKNKENYSKRENKEYKFYKKMVVFVNLNETAHYLNRNIENSILINGEIDMNEKWKRFNEFKNCDSDKDILIITNVACEGQDMDFCNTLVNYDLTYNPIQLAQRKGRIDRFEVKKSDLFIYNFAIEGVDPVDKEIKDFAEDMDRDVLKKYENSIYTVLLRKLQEIKKETGIYYNVVDTIGKTININKESAKQKVAEAFELIYGDKIQDFNSIKVFHKKKSEKQYQKMNTILKEKQICVSPNDDNIIIEVDKNNRDFLRYVYDGGTMNSHFIYNDK
nr:helicase-related protein [uncultured Anaerosporobacter sp.]